ncbi:cupin domain-containing protein [Methanolobus profundi]|uniref:Mannose-6-phosphate isomerase, cupin superfamily n=1 Tax=Methanolobus profundi TaxID=487685 RepID=A0A1I4PCA0_9EURY|nr:cupin domain-containing protein [Methanolobus profundi]SFM25235.1 Mannose-6-phosphate isomerase, cupin superfamily [Methanolobus profundi]
MSIKTSCRDVEAYITKDGSSIRELIHPQIHGNSAQSVAEATVPAGTSTLLHRHNITEEIYHILSGSGWLTLNDKIIEVETGDSVCIHPGVSHNIKNTGTDDLRILCCCSPAYSHDDTEVLE